MQPGAGDPDIEEPALLLDLFVGLGVRDRHHALGQADQEHGVPLQTLGRVERGEGDALDGRGVLGRGALVQLGHQIAEGRLRPGPYEVLGEANERRQRLPAVPHGARARGRFGGPALGGEHGPHLGRQVDHVVEQGVVPAEAGRAAQGGSRLPYLLALEEPLRAPELVGHPGVGECLFVDLRLGVDPVQDGDLAGGNARSDEVADPARGALGLGRLVRVLRVDGLGARVALGDQFQPVFGGASTGLIEQAVGQVHDLGVER